MGAPLRATGARRPDGLRLDPALDFDRSEAGLAALLSEAGLIDVVAATARFDFAVEPEPLWRSVEAGIGVIGTTWRRQTAAMRAAMRDAYRTETARLAADGVLRFPAVALLAVGRRSGGAAEGERLTSSVPLPADPREAGATGSTGRSSPLPADQAAGGTPVPILRRRSTTNTAVVSTAHTASTT